MATAVIYARYSPRRLRKDAAGGTKECESNAAQIESCRAFAQAEGFDITAEFQDDALSGGASLDEDESARPGLWAAVDAVPRGGYLLVYKFDRLGRDGFLLADIKRALFSKRAAIISASDGERIDAHLSPSEKLRFSMVEAFAEYERAMIRQRTTWAMRAPVP